MKLGIASASPDLLDQARASATASELGKATDIIEVRYSMARLEAIADWLRARLERANARAATPLGFGIRPDRNAVQLSIPSGDATAAQEDIIDAAARRYGDAVELERLGGRPRLEACSYPFCDAPLRAGVRNGTSATFASPSAGACTAGFLARGSGADSNVYQLTAGHCQLAGTWGTLFRTGGAFQSIGSWQTGTQASWGDAGMYLVSDTRLWNWRPWVYWPGTSEGYPMSSDANPVVGQTVCMSGSYYGSTNCGRVSSISYNTSLGGPTVMTLVRTTYCSTPGDSGSPIHYFGTAYGLHTGRLASCDSVFTRIQAAETALGVTVSYASSCDPLFESPIKIGDMDGDGKDDVYQFAGGGNAYAWQSTGSAYTGLGLIGTGFGSAYQTRVGDRDGDGDDDLFQVLDDGRLWAWRSDRTRYTALGQIASGFGSACDSRMADINGDAKDDLLQFTNDGYAYGWLSTGTSYTSLGQVGTGFGSTYQDRAADMDGDGDGDLFQILDSGDVHAWHSNGSRYTGIGIVATGAGSSSQVRFGDKDGDGDEDMFQFTDSGNGYAWTSNGSRFTYVGSIGSGFGLTRQVRVVDMNGDSRADILKFQDDGRAYAWLSSGSSYTSLGNVGSGFGVP